MGDDPKRDELEYLRAENEKLRADLLDAFKYRDALIRERDALITASAAEASRDNERENDLARLRRLADVSVAYLDCRESTDPQHDDCLDDYGCGARADWENATEDERAAREARGTK